MQPVLSHFCFIAKQSDVFILKCSALTIQMTLIDFLFSFHPWLKVQVKIHFILICLLYKTHGSLIFLKKAFYLSPPDNMTDFIKALYHPINRHALCCVLHHERSDRWWGTSSKRREERTCSRLSLSPRNARTRHLLGSPALSMSVFKEVIMSIVFKAIASPFERLTQMSSNDNCDNHSLSFWKRNGVCENETLQL